MKRSFLGLLIVLVLAANPQASWAETSRYSMTPVEGGALRLDTQTGAVSLCTEKDGAWSCAGVADEMTKLRQRIGALERENSALKSELGQQRKGDASEPQAEAKGPPPNSAPGTGGLKTPNDDEIDQMMQFMEKMARRLKGMVEDLKRDQSPPPAGEAL